MPKKPNILWPVDSLQPEPEVIQRAASILKSGGLVAFPTETVYGLGADALNPRAVERIFQAKRRPQDNPLIVHVSRREMVGWLAAGIPELAFRLIDAFWPGPLTIVLPQGKNVPSIVSAGLGTVALRMPAHPVALALIDAAGVPVAAPSANLSGRPSPTTAEHVQEDLGEHIDAILDGGAVVLGVESTVVDLTTPVPVILRPGGVTPDELKQVTGELYLDPAATGMACSGGSQMETTDNAVLLDQNLEDKPRSPGMKYRHYAPSIPIILVEGKPERITEQLQELASRYNSQGCRVGILACAETAGYYHQGEVIVTGFRQEPATVASRLYSSLRRFEELGVDIILAEGINPTGLGLAVMNRLRRAAGGNIIQV